MNEINMHLAQVNIARMRVPMGSPIMKDFEDNLDGINALAEAAPGFVWRFKEDNNNATSVTVFDDDYLLVNMSLWEDIEALFDFVYQSHHLEIFKRKKEWFTHMAESHMVLWYIEEGAFPSLESGMERLLYLREHGETPYAFTFKKRFTPAMYRSYKVN